MCSYLFFLTITFTLLCASSALTIIWGQLTNETPPRFIATALETGKLARGHAVCVFVIPVLSKLLASVFECSRFSFSPTVTVASQQASLDVSCPSLMPLFTPGAGGGRGEQQDPLLQILKLQQEFQERQLNLQERQLDLQERQLNLQERQRSGEVMFKST